LTTRADPTSTSSRGSKRRVRPLVRPRGRRTRSHPRPRAPPRAHEPSLQTSERSSAWRRLFHLHLLPHDPAASPSHRDRRGRLLPSRVVRTCRPSWRRCRERHTPPLRRRLRRRVQGCRFRGTRTTRQPTFSRRQATGLPQGPRPPPRRAHVRPTTRLCSDCPIRWQEAFRHLRVALRSPCDPRRRLRRPRRCLLDRRAIPQPDTCLLLR
jgi:hypothetical protein